MADGFKSDFSGYATKNDVLCSDGRVIRKNAFADQDGTVVPLVFQHDHTSPLSVIGKALLENRDDGVYAYGYLNDTDAGKAARGIIQHGDMMSLSIAANKVVQEGADVLHGKIREVSLVFAGANPEATIDNVIRHSADGDSFEDPSSISANFLCEIEQGDESGDPSEVFSEDSLNEVLHADANVEKHNKEDKPVSDGSAKQTAKSKETDSDNSDSESDDEDPQKVYDSLNDKQKALVEGLVGMALNEGETKSAKTEGEQSNKQQTVEQSADEGDEMNIFEHNATEGATSFEHSDDYQNFMHSEGVKGASDFTHAQENFFRAAQRDPSGSLQKFVLQHAQDYGIKNIDVFFPDARAERTEPDLYKRDTEWADGLLNGVHKVPWTRIKSAYVDLTPDEARAKGFTLDRNNNHRKFDEMITAYKRQTTPTTIYKKQKVDRDDVLDVTEFSVVNFLMREMRIQLDEEVARAILIGDGREVSAEDHINTECIRPVVSDDDLYVMHSVGKADETQTALVDRIRQSKVGYMGSGNLTAFVSPTLHASFAVQRDQMGRRLYDSDTALAFELGVQKIVEVPLLENFKLGNKNILQAIIFDPRDYTVGTDRGGDVTSFNSFDIDYNQYKYLIETRMSAALTKPKSAIVIEAAPKA
nr:MAG TPA: major capsid protein [Caudoviricetes sp.]